MFRKPMDSVINWLDFKNKGEWDSIYDDVCNKTRGNYEDVAQAFNEIKDKSYNFITILDDDYPLGFKDIYMPPFRLISNTDNVSNLLNKEYVGFIGEIDKSNFKKLMNSKESKNIVFSIDDLDEDKFKLMSKSKNEFIVFVDSLVDDKIQMNQYKNINFVSETAVDNPTFSPEQTKDRLVFGLADKVLLTKKLPKERLNSLDQQVKNNTYRNVYHEEYEKLHEGTKKFLEEQFGVAKDLARV